MPPDAPAAWKQLIGIYAGGADAVYVAEERGHLCLITKRLAVAGLERIRGDRYALDRSGILDDSVVVFHRSPNDRASGFVAGTRTYHRLVVGNENGKSFRIKPLKPANELRKIALAATPPKETGDFLKPDFVDLSTLDPTIRFDIRYATTNNFVGEKFYSMPKAFLQRPAAEALLRAHRWLKSYGFGLLIHDAYRPWYVTKMFWDATPDDKKIFVANPNDGSRHNRGCAVDLTLYDLKTGKQVEMTGGYDEMSERSYPSFPGGTSLERWHRELLKEAMELQGFKVFAWEWWHFDYKDWREYPIGTKTFEELAH
ncbi:MAG TPA: M15 family metallopeptidase [Bacteroidota bacterium]|nr:M15 family metallopeptidase [Bacteroidota bacterium]